MILSGELDLQHLLIVGLAFNVPLTYHGRSDDDFEVVSLSLSFGFTSTPYFLVNPGMIAGNPELP